jgi:hypothetical protein
MAVFMEKNEFIELGVGLKAQPYMFAFEKSEASDVDGIVTVAMKLIQYVRADLVPADVMAAIREKQRVQL